MKNTSTIWATALLIAGLDAYDKAKHPVWMKGNVFLKGARPSKHEEGALVLQDVDPGIQLLKKTDGYYLTIAPAKAWTGKQSREIVTSELLGMARVPNLPFVRPDDSPYRLDTDYFGAMRRDGPISPGPAKLRAGKQETLKL